MKCNSHYFVPGEKHLCMFCDVPIARLKDGKLSPLGNKAHVLMAKRHGGLYVINCCGDCARRVDFANANVLRAAHKAVMECRKRIAPEGRPLDPKDSPVTGFYRREFSIKDRPKHVRAYKDFVRKNAR